MVVLINHLGNPLFWPNVFAAVEYRNSNKSPKTTSKVLRTLGMVYLWAASRKLDLDKLLTKGPFLTANDVEDLALFLRLNSSSQYKLFESSQTRKKTKITRMEQVRGGFKDTDSALETTNAAEAATRIQWVASYLDFHLSRRQGPKQENIRTQAESAIKRLRQLCPREKHTIEAGEELEGLDDDIILIAEQALHPESPENPYRTNFNKYRNYLVWRLLLETGMRRGELTELKVEDVSYAEYRVAIKHSKTLPRTVPISSETANYFHAYVMDYWSQIPQKARQHGYLITSQKGEQLSEDTLNQIFRQLRNKVPGLPEYMAPHSLRRTWNDRFSRSIDESKSGMSPEQEKQVRNRLMGWSINSEMSERYSRRHIRKRADELGEQLANSIGKKNDDKP
ncbi:site-specific integrase [Sessilibacter corallicola]|uniref:Site-specific integrase n=2 Tax=Sessilibacter corallicola TaxID=2904075 RepID=A0ABQ0A3Y7_9GAMM